MSIAIVDRATKSVLFVYEADEPDQGRFGGPWGRSDETVHLSPPEGVPVGDCQVNDDGEGNLSLSENAPKRDARKQAENLAALQAFRKEKESLADAEIKTALNAVTPDAEETTHLMIVSRSLDVVANSDDYTAEELTEAQDTLAAYRPVYVEIQAIRAARDASIAAFEPPHTDVTPLYPV